MKAVFLRRLPLLVVSSFLALGASAQSLRVLPHEVPTAVSRLHLQPIGRLPASHRLHLAIGLPLRNQAALSDLIGQIYDPASTHYHHYLTPEQFTERFGPTETQYQTVMTFLRKNGFSIVHTSSNRVVLDVNSSVADIERAFHVTMRLYPHPAEARTFYAPDTEPSVSSAVPILHISGLDNYSLPHPMNLRMEPAGQTAAATPQTGSGPSGTYAGNDFRAAYVPGTTLNGSGQSVALLEFDGYFASDITRYESTMGLPAVPLSNVAVDGGVSSPGSGNAEVALDIEMAISMAPGLSHVIIYEAPNPSPWADLLNRIANDNLARQISCSWGGGSPDPTSEQIFKQMAVQGQSFFNASGDSDAFVGSVSFPSDSTNITQVGGTTLTTTGPGGSWSSETVWNWGRVKGRYVGSSGGVSTYYSIPVWQQGISMAANQGSTTMRNIPDVALTADNIWVAYNNGSSGAFGGTSCAAPLWAAFTALVNQQAAAAGESPVGFINPAIYAIGKGPNYAADFHDITTGNNFSQRSPTKYAAVSGYDLCTGWGTPNGIKLINALAPPVALVAPEMTLDSSENPSGFRDNVNFTASIALTNITGTIQFLTNGTTSDVQPLTEGTAVSANVSSLPRGTNVITAIYSGDANDLPATNTLEQIVTNHPPVAVSVVYNRLAGYPLDIPLADLATNWSDADGDTVSLAGVGVSTNGVTVTNDAGTLVYFNTNNVDDKFVCKISDGWGGTNSQTVRVAIVLTNTIPVIAGVTGESNGTVTLNLRGAPGYTYVLETTTNLTSRTTWQPLSTNTLGTNDVWQFNDTEATDFSQRFYRLMRPQ